MLILAAILLILMSAFHTILGEKLILQPINRGDNLPKIWGSRQATFRTIQATWHLVSVLWLGLAAQLLAIVFYPGNATQSFLMIFSFIFGVLAIVPFILRAGKHKTWIVFGLIAVLLGYQAASL